MDGTNKQDRFSTPPSLVNNMTSSINTDMNEPTLSALHSSLDTSKIDPSLDRPAILDDWMPPSWNNLEYDHFHPHDHEHEHHRHGDYCCDHICPPHDGSHDFTLPASGPCNQPVCDAVVTDCEGCEVECAEPSCELECASCSSASDCESCEDDCLDACCPKTCCDAEECEVAVELSTAPPCHDKASAQFYSESVSIVEACIIQNTKRNADIPDKCCIAAPVGVEETLFTLPLSLQDAKARQARIFEAEIKVKEIPDVHDQTSDCLSAPSKHQEFQDLAVENMLHCDPLVKVYTEMGRLHTSSLKVSTYSKDHLITLPENITVGKPALNDKVIFEQPFTPEVVKPLQRQNTQLCYHSESAVPVHSAGLFAQLHRGDGLQMTQHSATNLHMQRPHSAEFMHNAQAQNIHRRCVQLCPYTVTQDLQAFPISSGHAQNSPVRQYNLSAPCTLGGSDVTHSAGYHGFSNIPQLQAQQGYLSHLHSDNNPQIASYKHHEQPSGSQTGSLSTSFGYSLTRKVPAEVARCRGFDQRDLRICSRPRMKRPADSDDDDQSKRKYKSASYTPESPRKWSSAGFTESAELENYSQEFLQGTVCQRLNTSVQSIPTSYSISLSSNTLLPSFAKSALSAWILSGQMSDGLQLNFNRSSNGRSYAPWAAEFLSSKFMPGPGDMALADLGRDANIARNLVSYSSSNLYHAFDRKVCQPVPGTFVRCIFSKCPHTFATVDGLYDHMLTHDCKGPWVCRIAECRLLSPREIYLDAVDLAEHVHTCHSDCNREAEIREAKDAATITSVQEEYVEAANQISTPENTSAGEGPSGRTSSNHSPHGDQSVKKEDDSDVIGPRVHFCNWTLREGEGFKTDEELPDAPLVRCLHVFDSEQGLHQHICEEHIRPMKSIHAKKDWPCYWHGCTRLDTPFNQKTKLESHMKTHTLYKQHKCTFNSCTARFSTTQALDQHIRVHLNEKPFKCEICGHRFAHSSAFTMHQRTHTGQKPLQCPYPGCDKWFSESSNLSKHKKTHSTNPQHKCPEPGCIKAFHRKDQLRRHYGTHKKGQLPDGASQYKKHSGSALDASTMTLGSDSDTTTFSANDDTMGWSTQAKPSYAPLYAIQ